METAPSLPGQQIVFALRGLQLPESLCFRHVTGVCRVNSRGRQQAGRKCMMPLNQLGVQRHLASGLYESWSAFASLQCCAKRINDVTNRGR